LPTISIIVPIYNVEKYLNKCIKSILVQSFTDFELILVNDGSTDKCGEICDQYREMDNRITVIHKQNGGVSSSRNAGLKIARGDYIAFIDPDDSIEPNMYEVLLNSILEHNADLVVCPIKTYNFILNSISVSSIWEKVNFPLNKKEIELNILPAILDNKTYSLVSCVNKLYRKEIFDLNKIKFDEHMNHSEDLRLNYKLLTIINKLVFVDQPMYNYYIYETESLTKVFRENLYYYILENKKFMIDICEKFHLEKYIDSIRNHYTGVTLSHMVDVSNRDLSLNKKNEILYKIINHKEFYEDIISFNCHSIFYIVLKRVCIKKNVSIFIKLVMIKNKLKHYIGKVG
jgi:glycosyltransferase involved in cell wall biosynthesis